MYMKLRVVAALVLLLSLVSAPLLSAAQNPDGDVQPWKEGGTSEWPEGGVSGHEFCLIAGGASAGWPCDAVVHVCSQLSSPWCVERLAFELRQLGRAAAASDPEIKVSLAVVLPDATLVGYRSGMKVSSASAAKALWAAAAIDKAGTDAVAAAARPALVQSDNWAAGRLIDLAGGIDAVNEWLWSRAGLGGTHLWWWNHGRHRQADRLPVDRTRGNRTTAADLARFYAALGAGTLLGAGPAEALAGWLRQTPRPDGGPPPPRWEAPLFAHLPPAAVSGALHKAGWLPPGCCAHPWNLSIDAALIPLRNNRGHYAIAATAHGARNWTRAVNWIADAGCRIHALANPQTRSACPEL